MKFHVSKLQPWIRKCQVKRNGQMFRISFLEKNGCLYHHRKDDYCFLGLIWSIALLKI